MSPSYLESLIDKLASKHKAAKAGNTDWSEVWSLIERIGEGFKSVDFPSSDANDEAWERYDSLVQKVKDEQKRQRKKDGARSKVHRDHILAKGREARPATGGLVDLALVAGTGGLSAIADAMEDLQDKKELLRSLSSTLDEAFEYFSEHKDEMIPKHKEEVYEKLTEIREELEIEWDDWHEANDRAYRQKVRANIEKLERKLSHQREAASDTRDHLQELKERKRNAQTAEHRTRVAGWISEEQSKLEDIEAHIDRLEGWIDEERQKL